jgi:hypothetical protein
MHLLPLNPPTKAATNSVVAICVVLVPGAAVGAVGDPVNDGDAIVARNNISAILVVMLAVLDAMSLVFVVILAEFEVTRVSRAVIAFVLEVSRSHSNSIRVRSDSSI